MPYKFTEKQREYRPNTIPMGNMQPGQFGRVHSPGYEGAVVFCVLPNIVIKLYPDLDAWTTLSPHMGLPVEILPGYKCELEGV